MFIPPGRTPPCARSYEYSRSCSLLSATELPKARFPKRRRGGSRAWLDAFNSGDRAAIKAYIKTYDPKQSLDFMLSFRGQTGGFDFLGVESSEAKAIRFRVKEKASPTVAIGNIQLNDAQPPTVESFGLRAIPPGAVVENIKLDAAERQRALDGVASKLKEYYVFPETAQKMADALRGHQQHGDYDAVADGEAFATLLTKHLQDVSHDKHLQVDYSPYKQPADDIGYLKFNFFGNPDFCGPTAVAAMNFLAHVDAIIFDLRENGGGDPRMRLSYRRISSTSRPI